MIISTGKGMHNKNSAPGDQLHVIADFCLIPLGVGLSLSHYIALCEKVLRAHDLSVRLHAYGTNIEGPWDKVLAAVKECHQKLHESGVPRISTSLKIGTRLDRSQTIEEKILSVEEKL